MSIVTCCLLVIFLALDKDHHASGGALNPDFLTGGGMRGEVMVTLMRRTTWARVVEMIDSDSHFLDFVLSYWGW